MKQAIAVALAAGLALSTALFAQAPPFNSPSRPSVLGVGAGGTGVTSSTGTGSVVLSNSPTLVTPTLGAATATSLTMNGASAGVWTTPTYAGGTYTASSGSWTVDSGDVNNFQYTIINKTMTVNFKLITTTVSATPSALNITIPASKVSAQVMTGSTLINQGTWSAGAWGVTAGGTVIVLSKTVDQGSTAWSASSDATYVTGQAVFEIQ